MDLWGILATLRRRWYVVVVVAAVFAAGASQALQRPPTYAAHAQVLLKPVELERRNYLARLSPDLVSASTVVAQALAADGYGGRLGVSSDAAFYRVNVQEPGATLQRSGTRIGPVLAVDVRSPDAALTARTLDALLTAIDTQLRRRQSEANPIPASWVEATVLARTQTPVVLPLSRSRAALALALLGALTVLASGSLLISLESLARQSRAADRRRSGQAGDRTAGRHRRWPGWSLRRGGAHRRDDVWGRSAPGVGGPGREASGREGPGA